MFWSSAAPAPSALQSLLDAVGAAAGAAFGAPPLQLPALLSAASWLMIVTGALTFVCLTVLRLRAPYGKYAGDARGGGWGPAVPARLAWFLQEAPALVVPLWVWWASARERASAACPACGAPWASANTLLLVLFCAHYAHRALIFPLRLRGGKPTPAIIAAMAFAFCAFNGALQGLWLARAWRPAGGDDAAWAREPHVVLGLVLFVAGAAINLHADTVLLNLRKPGETGYAIPRGGFFFYVSGANYFGEIVEWAGWALAAGTLPAAAFAAFTFCNIGPRGAQHHAWLKAHFGDKYPRARTAVIPFLW